MNQREFERTPQSNEGMKIGSARSQHFMNGTRERQWDTRTQRTPGDDGKFGDRHVEHQYLTRRSGKSTPARGRQEAPNVQSLG